jgi:deoxyadenosine/deoxycytidine kinase
MKNFIASLRPRKCHIYCLGAAKTGTTSLAQMLSQQRRSAHEPETAETNQIVIGYLSKKLSKNDVVQLLKKRDRRLNLEFESSHPLGYFAEFLPELFKNSKFIITYRDPEAWLRSRVNFHEGKDPEEWRAYRNFIWNRHFDGFPEEETILKEAGLFSLDAYLQQYAEQYELLLAHLPADRTLLLKTEEIDLSTDRLVKFCGEQTSLTGLTSKRTNTYAPANSLLNQIDAQYAAEKVAHFQSSTKLADRLFNKFTT